MDPRAADFFMLIELAVTGLRKKSSVAAIERETKNFSKKMRLQTDLEKGKKKKERRKL